MRQKLVKIDSSPTKAKREVEAADCGFEAAYRLQNNYIEVMPQCIGRYLN